MSKNTENSKPAKNTKEHITLKKRTARLILKLIDKYLDWEQKDAWKKGVVSSLVLWLIFALAEAGDEKILDTGCLYAWFVVLLGPLTVFIEYCFAYIHMEYTAKDGIVRIVSYTVQNLINFFLIVFLMSIKAYPVEQIKTREGGNSNGVEFMFMLVTSIAGFVLPVLIFHPILFAGRKIKKSFIKRKGKSKSKDTAPEIKENTNDDEKDKKQIQQA